MLIESRINERCTLTIDAETVGGIDKGSLSVHSHPDKMVPLVVAAIRGVAESVGQAVNVDMPLPPSEMEIAFTVRMDSNAIVSIARAPDAGQFKVTLRWKR
ncbi:MAG: CU044_2847 family protein [Pseudomonadota bacterium]|nr:CU044_2847 family protein [Pseudomonadota bacterium]